MFNKKEENVLEPIVAIEDRLTGFAQPRRVQSLDVSVRDFKNLCKETPIAEDMLLWKIGEMNVKTGEITSMKPELLEKGGGYVPKN